MAKLRWAIFVPPAIFGAIVGIFLYGSFAGDRNALPSTMVGRVAPALDVDELAGAPLPTAAVLAEPGLKLVNFWASWCAPCRAEHPFLEEIAAGGLPVHGVNYKDKVPQALQYLADLGNPYTTLGADSRGRTGIEWGVAGVPETFLIDGDGKVVLRYAGPITRQEYDRIFAPAIAAARQGAGGG